MIQLETTALRGWVLPDGSRKYHYYQGTTTSLCGRYDVSEDQLQEAYDSNHRCADNCAPCQQKRQELQQHG